MTKEYEKQHNEKMKLTKIPIFDKKYVKVKIETFEPMNNVIKKKKQKHEILK